MRSAAGGGVVRIKDPIDPLALGLLEGGEEGNCPRARENMNQKPTQFPGSTPLDEPEDSSLKFEP